jgi:hypothetical protein
VRHDKTGEKALQGEENLQAELGLAGLDEHQVRRWLPWRRWTLLAILAHAPCSSCSPPAHTLQPARRPG